MDTVLISVSDAGKVLGLGKTTIYQLINENKLETVFIGARRLVRVSSVRRLAGEAEHGPK